MKKIVEEINLQLTDEKEAHQKTIAALAVSQKRADFLHGVLRKVVHIAASALMNDEYENK